ncbi:hypothetical protein BDZ89DRAFT_1067883 [Hymenopellis radicata]|nr:hypothetical protein BDZ89DRAFT_1067883 [Hymenopellis radicata]
MSSNTTPPRELHQRRSLTRPKFLRRISDKFTQSSSSPDTSGAARREAALRERGLVPPSRGSTWPAPIAKPPSEPAYFADRPHYDASAAKRRREDALRERGLLPPAPVPSTSSAPVSRSSSSKRDAELREKGLLPPSIHRRLEEQHEKHGGEWDATTLVDEIRMERSLGTRQTAAERIKAEWETRRSSSELLRPPRRQAPLEVEAIVHESAAPIPHHRPRPLNTPVDGLGAFTFPVVARPTTKDLPLLDTNPFPALTRSLSSPSLSGETLRPRQPLELKVHNPNTMAAEMEKIHDKESRRMTMLAFM